jgi:peptidoglycan hydrolase-like protein with peptidoglycan-binding domain
VTVLQEALSVLGFACGALDGIFGAFTERAVREFQRNAGLPADGIVGPETSRTIVNLRHVWEGKDAFAHSEARIAPARAADVLTRVAIAVCGEDADGLRVAQRLVNLAQASAEGTRMRLVDDGGARGDELIVCLCAAGAGRAIPGRPLVHMESSHLLAARLATAFAALSGGNREVTVELEPRATSSEREEQRAAVVLLDAVCVAFD